MKRQVIGVGKRGKTGNFMAWFRSLFACCCLLLDPVSPCAGNG